MKNGHRTRYKRTDQILPHENVNGIDEKNREFLESNRSWDFGEIDEVGASKIIYGDNATDDHVMFTRSRLERLVAGGWMSKIREYKTPVDTRALFRYIFGCIVDNEGAGFVKRETAAELLDRYWSNLIISPGEIFPLLDKPLAPSPLYDKLELQAKSMNEDRISEKVIDEFYMFVHHPTTEGMGIPQSLIANCFVLPLHVTFISDDAKIAYGDSPVLSRKVNSAKLTLLGDRDVLGKYLAIHRGYAVKKLDDEIATRLLKRYDTIKL